MPAAVSFLYLRLHQCHPVFLRRLKSTPWHISLPQQQFCHKPHIQGWPEQKNRSILSNHHPPQKKLANTSTFREPKTGSWITPWRTVTGYSDPVAFVWSLVATPSPSNETLAFWPTDVSQTVWRQAAAPENHRLQSGRNQDCKTSRQPIILHTHHGYRRQVKKMQRPRTGGLCISWGGSLWKCSGGQFRKTSMVQCVWSARCSFARNNDTTWCWRSYFHVMSFGFAMNRNLLRDHRLQIQHSTPSAYWQPQSSKLR